MPKVKSEIMNDENFVKMFVNKYGQEPKNLFNDFGENFNSLEFYLENGQLKLFVRSDIARAVCRKLLSYTDNSNSRKFSVLDRSKADTESLLEFFNQTNYSINGAKYPLMVNGSPNLSVLKFDKVGNEDGQRVTIGGIYLISDIETWSNAVKQLIAKMQKELLAEFTRDFAGVFKVRVIAKVEFVDEVDNS